MQLERGIRGIWGVFSCEVEYLGKVLFEGVVDLVSGDGGVQDFVDRGHGGVGDAAVVYQGEMVEIGGDVEGEAMHGYPTLHVDTDGCNLVFADPDAGFIISPDPRDAEADQGVNQDFFQLPEVLSEVCAVSREVHDGITDNLTRAVVGDISAAIGVDQLNATVGKLGLVDEDVIEASGAAQGDYGGVFEEDKGVGDKAGDAAVPEVGLDVEGGLIVNESEFQDLQYTIGCRGLSVFGQHREKDFGPLSSGPKGFVFLYEGWLNPETVENLRERSLTRFAPDVVLAVLHGYGVGVLVEDAYGDARFVDGIISGPPV